MTLRSAAPQTVKAVGRVWSVRVGSATAGRRQLPSFILVGAQRAGTTSLFRALMSHPLVHPANFHKGVNYFDVNYDRDFSWYQGHFPTAASLRRRSRRTPGEPITFEASGYYMFHPCAAQRIAQHLPEVRILAMLRDPIERAYSAWKHELARGYETESSFERALDREDERLAGQVERMLADPRYQSFSHRHHAYVRRGQYAEQLLGLHQFFPWDQMAPPRLGHGLTHRWNGRPSSPMPESARTRLRAHFSSHDESLAALLGREPAWVS